MDVTADLHKNGFCRMVGTDAQDRGLRKEW